MPSATLNVKPRSDRARRILRSLQNRIAASRTQFQQLHNKWKKAEEDAIAYIPEQAADRRADVKIKSGVPEYKKIKIPYSYGLLLSSHTYWTSVFLSSRSPILQFEGRHGEAEEQTLAIEALINYQMRVGQMLVPLYLWLYDVGKYGFGVLRLGWRDEYSYVARFEETEELLLGVIPTGRMKKQKITEKLKTYSGNQITNLRPYDFYPDPRHPVRSFQKGEFCGCYVEIGLNQILKRTSDGYYIEEAVAQLRARGDSYGSTEKPYEGSEVLELPSTESFFFDEDSRDNTNKKNILFKGFEIEIELIPSDWDLGASSNPEKWVFTVSDDFTILLGAQPHGAYHDKFSFSVLEYEPEAYAVLGRGIPEIAGDLNDVLDWLINSHMFNTRKALNNQFVFDPTKINPRDLLQPGPGGGIRLSPLGYGQRIDDVIKQLPIVDVTRGHMADLGAITEIGQRAFGNSDQLQGFIPPTGRRSATEVRTGTGFGVNRLKTNCEYFSAMGWAPLAQMMLQNTQQYYDEEQKFRIAGSLAATAGESFVNVTPETIAGFYDLIPVDGTLPVDRLAQGQAWSQLLGQLRNLPEVMMKYDIGRIFEWVAQLHGLRNIQQFRIEQGSPEDLAKQAEMGNLIPVPGGAGTQGNPGNPSPRQPPIQTLSGGPQQ